MAISSSLSYADVEKHETKAHGSTDFPAACYLVGFPETIVPAHWHSELEIIHVKEGCLRLTTEANTIQLEKDTGLFINSDVIHAAESANPKKHTLLHTVIFHPVMIADSKESVFWKKYIQPLINNQQYPVQYLDPSVSWQEKLLSLQEDAWSAIADETDGYEFTVRNRLSDAVYLLCRHQPDPDISDNAENESSSRAARRRRNSDRIKKMITFIQSHYFEKIQLKDIASAGMISRSECSRCFQDVLGISPIQYLNQYRLQVAARELRETDWLISEIGYRSGFTEMGYFSSQFRKVYGMTPGEYRRM